ncbi:MAG: 30S ribosomal protein S8 [Verrucomicrobia bacterium]|nr:30S ribosomal protein S8 [Verrucomicrobiota bacterium]MBS0647160.1 30S ribosomal protein S8 [Verrucomicrobiota bacterium]
MNDPIADLLTRIRNASAARRRYIDLPHSKLKEGVVKVLKQTGFVAHYLVKEENKKVKMRIFLKYSGERQPVLQGLKRISKPSLRKYVGCHAIPRVLSGMGIAIVSTSQGLMDGERARDARMGGELLAIAW